MKNTAEIPFQRYQRDTSHIAQAERNDCVVRAIATAFDIDYLIAHSVLNTNGRKARKGTYRDTTYRTINQLCNSLGYSNKHLQVNENLRVRATDVALTNKHNKDAIILIFTPRHLTLFKDGKLQDSFVDDRYVNYLITINKTKQDGNQYQKHDTGATLQSDSRTIKQTQPEIVFKF